MSLCEKLLSLKFFTATFMLGVRMYGRDFKAIAEVIGNKTESLVRSFFVNYRRRYNLDEVLAEYEKENGKLSDSKEPDREEVDCICLSLFLSKLLTATDIWKCLIFVIVIYKAFDKAN